MQERTERDILLQDWHTRSCEVWSPEAQEILSLVEHTDVVILNGSNRSGKTSFLSPQIKKETVEKGWNYGYVDVGRPLSSFSPAYQEMFLQETAATLPELKQEQIGLVIIDEPGHLTGSNRLHYFISLIESRGYNKYVFVPTGSPDEVRIRQVADITSHLSEIGQSSIQYDLQRKQLPENLAQELLEFL